MEDPHNTTMLTAASGFYDDLRPPVLIHLPSDADPSSPEPHHFIVDSPLSSPANSPKDENNERCEIDDDDDLQNDVPNLDLPPLNHPGTPPRKKQPPVLSLVGPPTPSDMTAPFDEASGPRRTTNTTTNNNNNHITASTAAAMAVVSGHHNKTNTMTTTTTAISPLSRRHRPLRSRSRERTIATNANNTTTTTTSTTSQPPDPEATTPQPENHKTSSSPIRSPRRRRLTQAGLLVPRQRRQSTSSQGSGGGGTNNNSNNATTTTRTTTTTTSNNHHGTSHHKSNSNATTETTTTSHDQVATLHGGSNHTNTAAPTNTSRAGSLHSKPTPETMDKLTTATAKAAATLASKSSSATATVALATSPKARVRKSNSGTPTAGASNTAVSNNNNNNTNQTTSKSASSTAATTTNPAATMKTKNVVAYYNNRIRDHSPGRHSPVANNSPVRRASLDSDKSDSWGEAIAKAAAALGTATDDIVAAGPPQRATTTKTTTTANMSSASMRSSGKPHAATTTANISTSSHHHHHHHKTLSSPSSSLSAQQQQQQQNLLAVKRQHYHTSDNTFVPLAAQHPASPESNGKPSVILRQPMAVRAISNASAALPFEDEMDEDLANPVIRSPPAKQALETPLEDIDGPPSQEEEEEEEDDDDDVDTTKEFVVPEHVENEDDDDEDDVPEDERRAATTSRKSRTSAQATQKSAASSSKLGSKSSASSSSQRKGGKLPDTIQFEPSVSSTSNTDPFASMTSYSYHNNNHATSVMMMNLSTSSRSKDPPTVSNWSGWAPQQIDPPVDEMSSDPPLLRPVIDLVHGSLNDADDEESPEDPFFWSNTVSNRKKIPALKPSPRDSSKSSVFTNAPAAAPCCPTVGAMDTGSHKSRNSSSRTSKNSQRKDADGVHATKQQPQPPQPEGRLRTPPRHRHNNNNNSDELVFPLNDFVETMRESPHSLSKPRTPPPDRMSPRQRRSPSLADGTLSSRHSNDVIHACKESAVVLLGSLGMVAPRSPTSIREEKKWEQPPADEMDAATTMDIDSMFGQARPSSGVNILKLIQSPPRFQNASTPHSTLSAGDFDVLSNSRASTPERDRKATHRRKLSRSLSPDSQRKLIREVVHHQQQHEASSSSPTLPDDPLDAAAGSVTPLVDHVRRNQQPPAPNSNNNNNNSTEDFGFEKTPERRTIHGPPLQADPDGPPAGRGIKDAPGMSPIKASPMRLRTKPGNPPTIPSAAATTTTNSNNNAATTTTTTATVTGPAASNGGGNASVSSTNARKPARPERLDTSFNSHSSSRGNKPRLSPGMSRLSQAATSLANTSPAAMSQFSSYKHLPDTSSEYEEESLQSNHTRDTGSIIESLNAMVRDLQGMTDGLQTPIVATAPAGFGGDTAPSSTRSVKTTTDVSQKSTEDQPTTPNPTAATLNNTNTTTTPTKPRIDPMASNDRPALVQPINNDLGIPKGDVMISLLSEQADVPWADRIHEAIWRCRVMRQNMDMHWLRQKLLRKPGSPSKGRISVAVDVDDARVVGGLQSVANAQKAALEHLRYDDLDDALAYYEDIAETYYGHFEESIKSNSTAADLEDKKSMFNSFLAACLHNLGIVHLLRGEHQEAFAHFERATMKRSTTLGNGHTDHIASHVKSAICHIALGRLTEGVVVLEECLTLSKSGSRSISDQRQVAEIYNNLACLYYSVGNMDKAGDYFVESLQAQTIALEHSLYAGARFSCQSAALNLSVTKSNIGFMALVARKYAAAIDAFEYVVQQQQLLLRDAHTTLISSMDHLVVAQLVSGHKDKALRLLRRMYHMQNDAFGPSDERCHITSRKISMLEDAEAQQYMELRPESPQETEKKQRPAIFKMFKSMTTRK